MSSIFRGIVVILFTASLIAEEASAFLSPSSWHIRHGSSTTSLLDTFQKDSFDMDELRQRIRAERTKPFSNLVQPSILKVHPTLQQQQPKVETVYIVSFQKCGHHGGGLQRRGGGGSGVHSIEYPKGSGNNVILAFCSREACDKFAETLKAQHFFDPTPQAMSIEALVDLCMKIGVSMQLIPAGVDLIPPKQNVPHLGLPPEPNKRTREQLDAAFYLLDDADDLEEEGVLWDYTLPSAMPVGVFD